jgi:hypothetical protein
LQTWKWPKTGIKPDKINMYAQELKYILMKVVVAAAAAVIVVSSSN